MHGDRRARVETPGSRPETTLNRRQREDGPRRERMVWSYRTTREEQATREKPGESVDCEEKIKARGRLSPGKSSDGIKEVATVVSVTRNGHLSYRSDLSSFMCADTGDKMADVGAQE